LYEPDTAKSWQRLRGIAQLEPKPRARAKAVAVWRERMARERDLPRAWILSDAAIFSIAHAAPADLGALQAVQALNERFAAGILEALQSAADAPLDETEALHESRPTPQQKALMDRLYGVVDARAAELAISAEVLAPRGELKALAMGKRDSGALSGWRREEIGTSLLNAIGA
jgi:ribonuclease D